MRAPIPKAIQDAPDLRLGLEFVYKSFWELSTARPVGWGPGPIPWTVIRDFADFHQLDQEDFEEFVFLIRAMDQAFLAYHSEQAKKEKSKPGGK